MNFIVFHGLLHIGHRIDVLLRCCVITDASTHARSQLISSILQYLFDIFFLISLDESVLMSNDVLRRCFFR